MEKAKKSQIVKLFLIAALLFITPLLSSSLRPTYLYFIINLLIIALGAEAGLLSFFSNPPPSHDYKKFAVPPPNKPAPFILSSSSSTPTPSPSPSPSSDHHHHKEPSSPISTTTHTAVVVVTTDTRPKAVEKSASEKIVGAAKLSKIRKSPSTPSLFFIGGGEAEAEAEEAAGVAYGDEDEDQEEVGGLSGQELFTKAETFIGNFYKQLKMQREESWKRLHDLYHKAF